VCMNLYVASDQPIAATSWSEAHPGFNIQPLSEAEDRVRVQFSKPHVMYLGAHTGCSCGFAFGQPGSEAGQDIEQEQLGRESVASLREFLHSQLTSVAELELYSCWYGDEGTSPDARVRVTPEHFGGQAFDLPERVFYRVRGAAER